MCAANSLVRISKVCKYVLSLGSAVVISILPSSTLISHTDPSFGQESLNMLAVYISSSKAGIKQWTLTRFMPHFAHWTAHKNIMGSSALTYDNKDKENL